MKTIIIGLGNPILGDDGIGWRVAEKVDAILYEQKSDNEHARNIDIECLSVGGLTLMEHLIDYDHAILIDAITSGQSPLGHVSFFPINELPNRAVGHFSSAHDTTLQNAIQAGRKMGVQLPMRIDIVAIEAQAVFDFTEQLSPPIAAAIPKAVQTVMELLK